MTQRIYTTTVFLKISSKIQDFDFFLFGSITSDTNCGSRTSRTFCGTQRKVLVFKLDFISLIYSFRC